MIKPVSKDFLKFSGLFMLDGNPNIGFTCQVWRLKIISRTSEILERCVRFKKLAHLEFFLMNDPDVTNC